MTQKMAMKSAEKPLKKKAISEEQEDGSKPFTLAGIKEFFGEVQGEYKKIAWPDKKVTMGSTMVVIVLVFIIAMYLGAVDLIIGKIVTGILK